MPGSPRSPDRQVAVSVVRVAWSPEIEHSGGGIYANGGVWFSDIPAVRKHLQRAVDAQNLIHGVGSHWLESRDRVGDPPYRRAAVRTSTSWIKRLLRFLIG